MEAHYENPAEFSPPPPPPPPKKSAKRWPLVILILAVLAALAVAITVLIDPFGEKSAGPPAEPKMSTPTTVVLEEASDEPTSSAVTPTSAVEEPSTPATAVPESAAGRDLENLRRSDNNFISSRLMGSWVVQLASSKKGSDDAAYLAKHDRLNTELGAFLTTTDDFQNRRETGDTFWVTFSMEGFSSKEDAESWCEDRGLDSNSCQVRELKP